MEEGQSERKIKVYRNYILFLEISNHIGRTRATFILNIEAAIKNIPCIDLQHTLLRVNMHVMLHLRSTYTKYDVVYEYNHS